MILTKANGDYFAIPFKYNDSRSHLDFKLSFIPTLDGVNDITIFSLDDDFYLSITDVGTSPVLSLTSRNSSGSAIVTEVTTIPVVIGSVNNIRFKRTFNESSLYTVEFWNSDSDEYYFIENMNGSFGAGDIGVVFGSAAHTTPVADSNIEFIYADLSGDYIDFRQTRRLGNDGKYVSVSNTEGVLTSSNEAAVRANNVNSSYQNTIVVTGEDRLKEGAIVDITGDVSSPHTTNSFGEIVSSLTVGSYPYTVNHTNFDESTGTLLVDVNGVGEIVDLTLTPAAMEKSYISQSKEGTDDVIAGKLGYFYTKPDGTKTYYNPNIDAFENLNKFTGDVVRYFNSVDDLRKKLKSEVGEFVATSSYYGDDNGGGTTFKCVSIDAIADGYEDNGGTVIVTNNNDAFEIAIDNPRLIDVSIFGAVGDVRFGNVKNKKAHDPVADGVPSCTNAVNAAMDWLGRNGNNWDDIPEGTLVFSGHFYAHNDNGLSGLQLDALFDVPKNMSIWMQGTSSVHTDYDGILFRMQNAYRTRNRYNVYYYLWDATQRYWWVKNGETEAVNKYSTGVQIYNGRKNYTEIESYGFVYGVDTYGKDEGAVENTYILGDILNCRYGIHNHDEFGGWAHQNHFIGGRVKNESLSDYHGTIDTLCAAVYSQGDSCNYRDINFEGNAETYRYVIYETGSGRSLYLGCRFELSQAADSIVLAGGSAIIEGHDLKPTAFNYYGFSVTRLKEYSSLASFPSTGIIGYLYKDTSNGNIYDWNGSIYVLNTKSIEGLKGYVMSSFTSGIMTYGNGIANFTGANLKAGSNLSSTLNIGVTSDQQPNDFVTMYENDAKLRNIFYANGDAEFHSGNNSYVDLEIFHTELGIYNLIDYTAWESEKWYPIGTWFTAPSGQVYMVMTLYQSGTVDLNDDISNYLNTKLLLKTGTDGVYFKDNKVSAKGFYSQDEDNTPNAAIVPFGTADDHVYNQNTISFIADVTYTPAYEEPVFYLQNTSGSEWSLYLDSSNETAGREILLINKSTSNSSVRLPNTSSSVISLTNTSIVLSAGEWCIIKAIRRVDSSLYYYETLRSSYGSLSVKKIWSVDFENDFSSNIIGINSPLGGSILHDAAYGGTAKGRTSDTSTSQNWTVKNDVGFVDGERYRVSIDAVATDSASIDYVQLAYKYANNAPIDKILTPTLPVTLSIEFNYDKNETNAQFITTLSAYGLDAGAYMYYDNLVVERVVEVEDNIFPSKIIKDSTYTVLTTDSSLRFTNTSGCTVTLPATTNINQQISYYNYCGVGNDVVFQDDGSSNIILGTLLTLEYGKYAGSEVIEDNVWSLTGDLI